MSLVMVRAWRCRACHHVWIAEDSAGPPARCPKRPCRSRTWNRDQLATQLPAIRILPWPQVKQWTETSELKLRPIGPRPRDRHITASPAAAVLGIDNQLPAKRGNS
jgi:hypothetical protein